MRADRLVSILLWLQVHGTTSTTELARRLEVSSRTIHRDMDALSAAGIPVFALRGRNGGWALPDEYRGHARWLSAGEVQALAVASPAQVLADLGLGGIAEAAWLKLLAALPPPHRVEAAAIQSRVHVDPGMWRPQPEPTPWLAVLKQGVFCDRLVRMRYRRADRTTSERTIAPLGLIAKGTTWYIVAEVDGDTRTYRVSRIEQAELLEARFRRPDGFDLAAYWEESKASLVAGLPRYPVTLRVDAGALDSLRPGLRWGRIERVTPATGGGWCVVSATFELFDYALQTALSLSDRAEVLEPVELRDAVIRSLRESLARYGDRSPRDTADDSSDNYTSRPASEDAADRFGGADECPAATPGATITP